MQYFTDSCDTTLFRAQYHRHTLFAIESICTSFHNDPEFGGQSSCVLGRNGDLLMNCVLEVTLTKLDNQYPLAQGTFYPVEALVKDVTLSISGQPIERHTSDWFRIYDSMIRAPETSELYKRLANFDATTLTTGLLSTETLYLPMIFTFTRHPGLALPMVALYLSEVKLTFTWATAEEVGVSPDGFTAAVWCDYAYLSDYERKYFLETPIQQLVEQVQFNGGYSLMQGALPTSQVTARVPLRFFRPVKSLFWALKEQPSVTPGRTHHGRYVGDRDNTYLAFQPSQYSWSGYGLYETISEKLAPISQVSLLMNGVDRFAPRHGRYFNIVQPYQATKRAPLPGMYMYTFALLPESVFPSGEANFSAIQDVQLQITLKMDTTDDVTDAAFAGTGAESTAKNIGGLTNLLVFATSYNLLHTEAGRAHLVMGDST